MVAKRPLVQVMYIIYILDTCIYIVVFSAHHEDGKEYGVKKYMKKKEKKEGSNRNGIEMIRFINSRKVSTSFSLPPTASMLTSNSPDFSI